MEERLLVTQEDCGFESRRFRQMSNTETSITVTSHDCEYACLKTIEYHEAGIKAEWERRIKEEMSKKPFLWIFGGPAKTREEAIQRIKDDYSSYEFGASFRKPGNFQEFWIKDVRVILEMCRRSDSITLTKEDYNLIGHSLPKTSERHYRR